MSTTYDLSKVSSLQLIEELNTRNLWNEIGKEKASWLKDLGFHRCDAYQFYSISENRFYSLKYLLGSDSEELEAFLAEYRSKTKTKI